MKELLQEFASKAHLLGLACYVTPAGGLCMGGGRMIWSEANPGLPNDFETILDAIEAKGGRASLLSPALTDRKMCEVVYDKSVFHELSGTRTEAVVKAALELCKHLEATQ